MPTQRELELYRQKMLEDTLNLAKDISKKLDVIDRRISELEESQGSTKGTKKTVKSK
jgi:hypothetical protein